jgi:hypothetical protein
MKIFRYAFVAQSSDYDFSTLLQIAGGVKAVTTGLERDMDLVAAVGLGMVEFDPFADLLVPVGKVVNNVLMGMAAAQLAIEQGADCVKVALYREGNYQIFTVPFTHYPSDVVGPKLKS